MTRRAFVTMLGGAAAWPLAARAQQSERVRRIGVLMGTAENDPDQRTLVATFVQALAELGWRDGGNIRIEHRWASGDPARLRALAEELTRLAPDLIFVQGTPGTTALQQAAGTIPILFVMVTDPISSGVVASLARPGGSATGFTNYELAMGGKWLETLREAAPGVARIAVMHNPENPALPVQVRAIESAAPRVGVQALAVPVRNRAEIEQAIDAFAQGDNGGLLVLVDYITLAHRELIIRLANQRRLPAMFNLRVFAQSGGLMSYGVDTLDLFRRAAGYADRILRGARPGDLPVQQPTKFELVVNLRTAKALGIDIPPLLLTRADEVIE
jgi:ABC-type uncharacterized transport system substrate-binding protein